MNGTRVVVTGLGVASPLGLTPDALWGALLRGESGARPTTRWKHPELHGKPAATLDRSALYAALAPSERELHWPVAMATYAGRAALTSAGLPARLGEAPLFASCSIGSPGALERDDERYELMDPTEPKAFRNYSQGALVAMVAERLGASGAVSCMMSTCAGGNYAIGAALDALRRGEHDVALAGGLEEISMMVFAAFSQIRAVGSVCRPFDAARDGLLFGEGAAFLVLERYEHARARGAAVLAELLSVGYSNDAFHLVAPDAAGQGASLALDRALSAAHLTPADVDYVNAHGTGTPANDAAELDAIGRVFDGRQRPVAVSSTKGATGHLMGAASAIEALICVLALQRQHLPGTTGLTQLDPRAATHAAALEVLHAPRPAEVEVALSSGFGFGGNNAVLALAAPTRAAPLSTLPLQEVYVTHLAAVAGDVVGAEAVVERFHAQRPLAEDERRATFAFEDHLGKKGLRHVDRGALLWATAMEHDLATWPSVAPDRAGAVVGAAYGGYLAVMGMLRDFQQGGPRAMNPMRVPFGSSNVAASWWLIRRGLTGFNGALGSGECAGLDAIIAAREQIALGRADALVAGGAEGWVDELSAAIVRLGWHGLPITEGAAGLALASDPTRAFARVVAAHQAFDRASPSAALERVVEELLAARKLPMVDVVVTPRPAALQPFANHVLCTGEIFGELLGASSALAAVVGASLLTPQRRTAAHVLIAAEGLDGYASALLLEAFRPPRHGA